MVTFIAMFLSKIFIGILQRIFSPVNYTAGRRMACIFMLSTSIKKSIKTAQTLEFPPFLNSACDRIRTHDLLVRSQKLDAHFMRVSGLFANKMRTFSFAYNLLFQHIFFYFFSVYEIP